MKEKKKRCLGVFGFEPDTWPIFLIVGLISIAAFLIISGFMLSGIVRVFGFACLWSIRELHEQVERVEKGWFPANPNRKKNLE